MLFKVILKKKKMLQELVFCLEKLIYRHKISLKGILHPKIKVLL